MWQRNKDFNSLLFFNIVVNPSFIKEIPNINISNNICWNVSSINSFLQRREQGVRATDQKCLF